MPTRKADESSNKEYNSLKNSSFLADKVNAFTTAYLHGVD
jgi:hypothetical protein